ncbi:MAG: DUF4390 domain-containing protein [candidate division Zixibacteria bacterium]|nr:DUF4390 domain-containing protein [candidate division Zixibacteria bacterium]
MRKHRKLFPFCLVLWCCLSPGVTAQGPAGIDFDLWESRDSLSVQLDLAPYITSKRIDQLKDGIEFAVEYQVVLKRPRRFWGKETISRASRIVRIGQRAVTEDFLVTISGGKSDVSRIHPSLPRLHQYLSDSQVVVLAGIDDLSTGTYYSLELDITCVSLTKANLVFDDDSSPGPKSPIKYLFKKFLQLTDFGREEFHAESAPFSLSEIRRRD